MIGIIGGIVNALAVIYVIAGIVLFALIVWGERSERRRPWTAMLFQIATLLIPLGAFAAAWEHKSLLGLLATGLLFWAWAAIAHYLAEGSKEE